MWKGFLHRLPFMLAVWAVGIGTGALILSVMHDNAVSITPTQYSIIMMLTPPLVAFICSIITVIQARQSAATVFVGMGISLVFGLVALYIVSGWLDDTTFFNALMSGTDETGVMRPFSSHWSVLGSVVLLLGVPFGGGILGAKIDEHFRPYGEEN